MHRPNNISQKKIKIPNPALLKHGDIAQVDVQFGGKQIFVLVGPDLLLRFEIGKDSNNHLLRNLKKRILRDKKFIGKKKQGILQSLLLADRESREFVNRDKANLAVRGSAAEFEDFKTSLQKRTALLKRQARTLGLDIIGKNKEFYCPQCRGFRSGPDLSKPEATCVRCKNLLKTMQIERIHDNDLVSYLRGNWLEDYVAHVLEINGWAAWSSPSLQVYGVSGAPHQIDVLAIKNGVVLVAECKTGDFTPTQVRTFLTKYYDVRCHQALAVSVGKIHADGLKIIEKNPAIDSCDSIMSLESLRKQFSKL